MGGRSERVVWEGGVRGWWGGEECEGGVEREE